jgi:hypothetical protein
MHVVEKAQRVVLQFALGGEELGQHSRYDPVLARMSSGYRRYVGDRLGAEARVIHTATFCVIVSL